MELEHLKIKTRLTNEMFASVKGECFELLKESRAAEVELVEMVLLRGDLL